MAYGASVVYSYTNNFTNSFAMRSELMEFGFRPNTPEGIRKVTDIIQSMHPTLSNICVVNLIPLMNDPKPKDEDDDWE